MVDIRLPFVKRWNRRWSKTGSRMATAGRGTHRPYSADEHLGDFEVLSVLWKLLEVMPRPSRPLDSMR